jgi:uncharacterized protein YydD (DUF2326 family)
VILSKLYSNLPGKFEPIEFKPGLNVVLAEIRLPENREKDSHNLGKTTVGRLIDYCLLSEREETFFLFKHEEVFLDFVFYLEVQLFDGTYVTVRRPVTPHSRISIHVHGEKIDPQNRPPRAEWLHVDVPIERATAILDGIFDLSAIKGWPYRKALGYFLRSQEDFHDVFRLFQFSAGKHLYWKPFVAHLLGLDADLIARHYELKEQVDDATQRITTLRAELDIGEKTIDEVNGLIAIRANEIAELEEQLSNFDFSVQEGKVNRALIDEIDTQINSLNKLRYQLGQRAKLIDAALVKNSITFNVEDATRLFEEYQIIFPNQLKTDFNDLINFNHAITEERTKYLRRDRVEIRKQLQEVGNKLAELNSRRVSALKYFSGSNSIQKFRSDSDRLVDIKADQTILSRQRASLERIKLLDGQIAALQIERAESKAEIEDNVAIAGNEASSQYSVIRGHFSSIIKDVIDKDALILTTPNSEGNLDFTVKILNQSGHATSEDEGHTYRKLLCIAFDLAVLRSYLSENFIRFVFHDGAFEQLDPRKRLKLLEVYRLYERLGIQIIVTALDTDLPLDDDNSYEELEEAVVLRLHDDGEAGLLFKMPRW